MTTVLGGEHRRAGSSADVQPFEHALSIPRERLSEVQDLVRSHTGLCFALTAVDQTTTEMEKFIGGEADMNFAAAVRLLRPAIDGLPLVDSAGDEELKKALTSIKGVWGKYIIDPPADRRSAAMEVVEAMSCARGPIVHAQGAVVDTILQRLAADVAKAA